MICGDLGVFWGSLVVIWGGLGVFLFIIWGDPLAV